MKIYNFFLIAFIVLITVSCDLDYENRAEITPDNIWNEKNTIIAFINDIHAVSEPGWPIAGNESDEAMVWNVDMPLILRGIVDKETTVSAFNYTTIEKINFFLYNLQNIVPEGILTAEEKKQLEGQAKFWRAWWYWSHVSMLGGVPLITEPQDVGNTESLFIPRNSTSECMEQIIRDLDDAIAALPGTWDISNYGRIDKCSAMAFKGRILLWYASPLFNPSGNQDRWQVAYNTNKEAVDFLRTQGKDLYPQYGDIWEKERNSEVVMVTQYDYPDRTFEQRAIRPSPFSKSGMDNDMPVLSLLLSFPRKDGSPMELDPAQLADDGYNKQFTDDFYTNRDDRFYASIFCGGTVYPAKTSLAPGVRFWCTWRKTNDTYRNMVFDQGIATFTGKTGFYRIKGLDKTLDAATTANASTDWIAIRFAEVLLNYGECANQVNKTQEALQVLYDIRKRAGIIPGADNRYGVTAQTKEQIQEAYINENFAEFAFENKRIGDLRRWKRYDIINNQGYRAALFCVLNSDEDVTEFDWTSDIMDADVRAKFHSEVIENVYGATTNRYNMDMNHWFYAVRRTDLERNSKLEQNNEWEGTFNPLE